MNLRGPFLLAQAAATILAQSGYGRIVLTASTAAFRGGAGTAAYAASKGGIVAMTRSLSLALAGFPDLRELRGSRLDRDALQRPVLGPGRRHQPSARSALVARIPLGAQGAPADVAATIAFLASPAAGYITGQTIIVERRPARFLTPRLPRRLEPRRREARPGTDLEAVVDTVVDTWPRGNGRALAR